MTTDKLNRDDLKPGQKAALVIRLFYEEERQKARERQVQSGEIYGIGKVSPDLDEPIKSERTDVALAKKAGIGKSNMANLLAVYRNRPDLFLAKTDDFRRFSHLPYLDYSAQIKTARVV